MAKKRGVEAKLARLGSLGKEPISPASVAELRKFLADASNFVVAEAAAIVGKANLPELAPDLVAAFDRFMVDPEETDKLCRAKIAIVEALNKLDYSDPEIFLRGIHHVQLEPVWGGTQDTAAALRGDCAFGLVRLNHRDAIALLVDLLVDAEKVARVAAVQALESVGSVAVVPLLRLKARVGDKEPEVTCECLTALLRREPEAVAFVGEFLHANDEAIGAGAALALGETRRPGAFEALRDVATDLSPGPLQEAVLLAIAMLRQPAAIDFLVSLICRDRTTRAAMSALAIHRHNEPIRDRVAAAVAALRDADLTVWFQRKFSVALDKQ
jgi:HEAT repeat protein